MNTVYNFRVIRLLRRRFNLTLEQLAERTGLTYATVAALETNKTSPSLKTLDAVANALEISTSRLLGLAENRLVQRRLALLEESITEDDQLECQQCRIARYAQGKMIRISADVNDLVRSTRLHEDVFEMCYVLSGSVELTIEKQCYTLNENDTILFDGLLNHSYTQKIKGEYITVHIPKDDRSLADLLRESIREKAIEEFEINC